MSEKQTGMKLQFTHQGYQKRAVDAVVQVFNGQPLAKSDFALATENTSVAYAADGSIPMFRRCKKLIV